MIASWIIVCAGAAWSPPALGAAADPVGVLTKNETTDEARQEAARTLAGHSGAQTGAIARLLEGEIPAASRVALARAAAVGHLTDPALLPGLTAMLDRPGGGERAAALRALSRFHTRESVVPVMDLLRRLEQERAGDAAIGTVCATLRAQTGMAEFEDDASAWLAWWERAQFMPRAEWNAAVTAAQSRRANEAEEAQERVSRQTVDLYRRLYAAKPDENRSELLAEMVQSPLVEVREAGFELVRRRLLNANPISDLLELAVTERLMDPSAAVRAQAARIVERLDRPEARESVITALLTEQNPEAAAGLLRAAAERPDARVLAAALRWFGSPDAPAHRAAVDALLACLDRGIFVDEEQLWRVRSRLRERMPDEITPGGMALLERMGDWRLLIALLEHGEAERADAAARVLERRPEAVETLIEAALRRPELVASAVRSLATHRRTSEGLERALALLGNGDGPSGPSLASLRSIAAAMPPDELLRFVRRHRNPVLVDRIVGPLMTREYLSRGDAPIEATALGLAVARARLERNRPGDALTVLEALPVENLGPLGAAVRTEALLRLNRMEEAEALLDGLDASDPGAPGAESWLAALEASIDQEFAVELAQRLEARLSDRLTPAQRVRLDASLGVLRGRLPGPPPESPPEPAGQTAPVNGGAASPRTQ